MAKKIILFNHKGGVSKTTSVFHIGWKLAEKGEKVLLVDADSQCNLTSIFLKDQFWDYYTDESTKNNNLMDGVRVAFNGTPSPIVAIDCPSHQRQPNLYLLPGHMNLTEYEPQITYAISSPATFGVMKNLPGAFNALIDRIADRYNIDYVLIDLNPGLSSINKVLFLSSDAFIVPTNPDMFCQMALNSLSRILPSWVQWKNGNITNFQDATYPLPLTTPKMLGTITQRFNIRYGKAAASFKDMINVVNKAVENVLQPALSSNNMLFADQDYSSVGITKNLSMAEIPDFQSLGQRYQEHGIPVFALNDSEMTADKVPLSNAIREKKKDVNDLYESVVDKIITILK